MHTRTLRAALWSACALMLAAGAGTAKVARAQATPAAQPTPTAPAAQSTSPAPATQPPPSAPSAPPAAAPNAAPAQPVPPPPPPADEPPPPQYGRLGGQPEQAVQEGDWNPWDHPEASGSYAHEGFFLRLQLGPGWSTVWNDDRTLDGVGLGMGLAIGGSIVPNLALHLDLQTTWMLSPSADRPEDDDVSNIGVQSLGLGVTYYIMPVELFLSASVGIGRLAFEDDDGQTKDTDAGIALDFLFGKEWWVGADWGIGVAAQLLYLHVTDYLPGDEGLDTVAINVLFTATYN